MSHGDENYLNIHWIKAGNIDDADKTDKADKAVDTKGGQPAEAIKRQRAKSLSNLVFQAKK